MNAETIIEKLEYLNRWRRGEESEPQPDPEEAGKVIDSAVRSLRSLIASNTTLRRERGEAREEVAKLKGALALGQENCDAAYDDLREERDEARAQLAVALTAANAEELRNTQAELARVKAEKFNYSKELRGVKCANDILNERHQTDIEELAALRRDKDRLDWMDAMSSASHMHFDRAAIDAAMNGGANG